MVKLLGKYKQDKEKRIAAQVLLQMGKAQNWVAKHLGISKQKVSRWAHNPIKERTRRTKLNEEYIDKIINMAKNKPTSEMGSRKIANLINSELKEKNVTDKNGKILSVTKSTINTYLKKRHLKVRKIKKIFSLTKKQKKQRVEFCQNILKNKIKGESIFFTDETQIKLGGYTNDYIRLSEENEKRLKKGDEEVLDLMRRPEKKFEQSILIGGGTSFYGLGSLILFEGLVNEFSYAQALLIYKEDYDKLNKNQDLIFEQDGASSHTSQNNLNLIKNLFKNNFIQNPPNSPDIASPIENIWGIIKPRIKKRNPKNLEDLKKYALEEWSKVKKSSIERAHLEFIERVKKIIEINGSQLDPFHINQIKKEMRKKYGEEENLEKEYKEEKQEIEQNKDMKLKVVYNDKYLQQKRKKELSSLNKEKRELTSFYAGERKNKEKNTKKIINKEKEKDINALNEKIGNIKGMDLVEYLKYLKNKESYEKMEEKEDNENNNEEEKNNEEESTIDDSINKILKLKNIQKNIKLFMI